MNNDPNDSFSQRFYSLKKAQKRRAGVPLYTLYLNRPVGGLIAAASPRFVTPNVLTLIGAVFTYLSIVLLMFFAQSNVIGWSVIGILLVVGFFFDSADGQLARLRNRGSISGEWLDHVLDSGRIALIHVATLWFLLRNEVVPPTLAVVVCAIFGLCSVVVFFGGILFDQLLPAKKTKVSEENLNADERKRLLVRAILMIPVDYGVLCWAFVLLPWPMIFFGTYIVLGLAQSGICVLLLGKWYRLLRAEDAARFADRRIDELR